MLEVFTSHGSSIIRQWSFVPTRSECLVSGRFQIVTMSMEKLAIILRIAAAPFSRDDVIYFHHIIRRETQTTLGTAAFLFPQEFADS